MMTALKMTRAPAPTAASAELISRTHIQIIDPPKKKLKTKKYPGTRHGNEFGATLTSCGDTPAELPSLAVPESNSDGNGSLPALANLQLILKLGEVFLWIQISLKCFKELRIF
jgi:hypothetical protein